VTKLRLHGLDRVPPKHAHAVAGLVLQALTVLLRGAQQLALVQRACSEGVEEVVRHRRGRGVWGSAGKVGVASVLEPNAPGRRRRRLHLRHAFDDRAVGRPAAVGHGHPGLVLHPICRHAHLVVVSRAIVAIAPGARLAVDLVPSPLSPGPAVYAPQAKLLVPDRAAAVLVALPNQALDLCRQAGNG